ncbi:protein BEAN1 [Eptesicus fuscus]|uniref:protein BEAN1 n=1 Tax=Eptesicus fuscus TaxID=29078 RepID=UPI002403AB76|nr:protein BEAN1 [Eptesicus fuscus]
MSLRDVCPSWPNHTNHFYAELENLGKKSVFVSPIIMASVVIGLVITISCVTIMLGSMHWDRQARLPPRRQRHYRGDSEDGPDSQEHSSPCSRGIHCACSLRGDRLAPAGSSHREAEASRLHWLHMDAPPSYEECTGPGATQLYLPTEAPPPYSLMDTDGGHQPAHSDLHTISVDALPPYEAVGGPCPPLSRLPLPGSEPEPSGLQGPPTPKGSLASSPEMIV